VAHALHRATHGVTYEARGDKRCTDYIRILCRAGQRWAY
jgi:hypothetical protein